MSYVHHFPHATALFNCSSLKISMSITSLLSTVPNLDPAVGSTWFNTCIVHGLPPEPLSILPGWQGGLFWATTRKKPWNQNEEKNTKNLNIWFVFWWLGSGDQHGPSKQVAPFRGQVHPIPRKSSRKFPDIGQRKRMHSLVTYTKDSKYCWYVERTDRPWYHLGLQNMVAGLIIKLFSCTVKHPEKTDHGVHFAANNRGCSQVKHHTLFVCLFVSISETVRIILQQHHQLL